MSKPMADRKKPAGGMPMWMWLAGAAILGGLLILIAVMSVVLVVVLTRDKQPIARVPDAPVPGDKVVEKGGGKPAPKEEPVNPDDPPIDPEPLIVDRKPSHVVGAAEWRVEGDELIVTNPTLKRAYLYFGSKAWTDYDFSFETKSAARNSGPLASFRAADPENHYGFSLGFLRAKHTLSRVEKGGEPIYDVPEFAAPFNLDQWYAVRIEVRGDQMRCYVDGKQVFDYKNNAHARGQVALGATPEGETRWKNIQVTTPDGRLLWDGPPELASSKPKPPPVVVSDGFVPLFNGKDLTGWKKMAGVAGSWRVENGILTGSAAEKEFGQIYTERGTFRDFHLRVEMRTRDKGLARLAFRSPENSFLGYQASFYASAQAGDSINVGGLMSQTKIQGRTLPRQASVLIPRGQWYTFEVIAQGEHLIVKVDGKVTTDAVNADTLTAGHIVLGQHGPSTMEFRKIEIKELKEVAVPPLPIVMDKDFVPLFNGKDLTGWKAHPEQPGKWRVENGLLIGDATGPNAGTLLAERLHSKNFHLRVEAKVSDLGAGWVRFRCPDGQILGYQAPINSTYNTSPPVPRTGSLSTKVPRGIGTRTVAFLTKTPVAAEQWCTLEILSQGGRITVKVDGQVTVDVVEASEFPGEGRIGLASVNGTIAFRKVEIRELPVVAVPPAVLADDFVPLFNGKDLDGWKTHPKQPGDWRVKDGVLVGAGNGALYTMREDYHDFHLRLEARINDGGRGAVFCRGPFGPMTPAINPTRPIGFQAELNNTDNTPTRTGSISLKTSTGATGHLYPSQLAPGEWFTLEMLSVNDRVSVKLNGKPAANIVDVEKFFPSGPIALSPENPGAVLEFRKIEIRAARDQVVAAPPPPPAPVVPDKDFVALFNGRDLTGWKKHATFPGVWRVENGILSGVAGPKNRGRLETEQTQPKDFHLRVEARISNAAAIGNVVFRCPQGTFASYESAFGTANAGLMMYQNPGIAMHTLPRKPDFLFQPKPGEWFTLELIAEGNRLIAKVNGKETTNAVDATMLAAGHIGLTVHTQAAVEFRRIEIKALKVVDEPPPPVVVLGDWTPLFNGKDLTGWRPNKLKPGNWHVEDGILIGDANGNASGYLSTERPRSKDLHLRVEARVSARASGGLYFRSTENKLDGYEAPINNAIPGLPMTGSLHAHVPGQHLNLLLVVKPVVPIDQWFTMEVLAQGNRLIVKVNGQVTADVKDENLAAAGHIQLYSANGKIEFRKVEIKDANVVAAPPPGPILADGFVPLFNGKDVTGWQSNRVFPGWRVVNGILTGTGPDLREIYTERDDYGDFHLRLEGRINDDGNNYVLFRYPHGPAELAKMTMAGYGARISSRAADAAKTGSLTVYDGAGLKSLTVREPVVAAGQWFTLEIIAQGNQVNVKVNGVVTKSYVNPKDDLLGGRIVLGFSDSLRPTVMEYRKIEIKEFKAVAAPPPARDIPLAEWAPLFNQKDLTGWRVEGNDGWKVNEAGDLIGQGPNTGLLTNRKDYKNFNVKIKLSADADVEAFFGLRQNPGPDGKWLGMTSRLTGDGLKIRAGSAGVDAAKAEKGTRFIEMKPGANTTFEFHVRQDNLRVFASNKATSGLKFAPDRHPPGAIGLFVVKGRVRILKFEIAEELLTPVAQKFEPGGEFVPLFNGKDLAGWQPRLEAAENWRVEKDVLTGAGAETAVLHTVRADYTDYHVRMEARITAGEGAGSSGILFRSAAGRSGCEATFAKGKLTGGLYLSGEDFGKSVPAKVPANVASGEWFTLDFIAQGKRLIVKVNDKETADFVDEENLFKSGHLALRQGAGSKLEVRKIELQELRPVVVVVKAPDPEPQPAKGEFVALFNGKDLTGWQAHAKRPGNWRVENGILIGSAPIGGSLYSTRGDYQDFHLRAEVRINDKGFGRIFGRAAYDPTKLPFKVLGYEVLINQRPLGDKTGTLTAMSAATTTLTQAKPAPAPAGDWILLEVLARGDLVTVKVNGNAVAEFRDDRRQFARRGHIALHQDANATIEFRKVEIEDLGAPKAPAPPP